jgi:E3 ubiquitin-protein ligase NEDD4
VVDRIWVVLGALDSWSEKYFQFAAAMRATLTAHAAYFNALVLGTSVGRSREEDVAWLITKNRDLLTFDARRHFSMTLLPDLDTDLPPLAPDMERPLEMLINRSRLLSGSFRYVSEAAIGDGVVREWISLVCRAPFDPQHGLFSPCPHNRRRFFLNLGKLISFPFPPSDTYIQNCGRSNAIFHDSYIHILLWKQLPLERIHCTSSTSISQDG